MWASVSTSSSSPPRPRERGSVSTSPGRSSRSTVARCAGRARPGGAPPSRRPCPSRGPRMSDQATLLVADDDPAVRQSLERTLTREGYGVVLAHDGQAALDRLRQGGVDLLLSDLKMPGLTGLELLKEAKAASPDVDVIILTAFRTVEEAGGARPEGRPHRLPDQAAPARAASPRGAPGLGAPLPHPAEPRAPAAPGRFARPGQPDRRQPHLEADDDARAAGGGQLGHGAHPG